MMKAYAALPERLYVILDGKVEMVGGVGPYLYDIDALRRWISSYKSSC